MPEPTEVHPCSRIDPQSGHKCANEANGHPWCKPCQAKYQREYQALRAGMAKTHGFARGVEALRAALVERFDALGGGMFSGEECAALIQQFPAPRPD